MITILLVDDHELVRAGLKVLIERSDKMTVCGAVASGEASLEIIQKQQPDVVLMDVKMPGMGGLEATRQISNMYPNIKILALTSYFSEPYATYFISAGALGYLTKDTEVDRMIEAITRVYMGEPYIAQGLSVQRPFKKKSDKDVLWDTLTEREIQVLLMLTHGLKPETIAQKLKIVLKTVNSYRYRIFEKLNIKNDVELTCFAIQYGLVDPNET